MKKLLTIAAASTALLASPALAGPTSSSDAFTITGNVATGCFMENFGTIDLGSLGINRFSGADSLQLNGNKTVDGNPVYVSCNERNHLTLTSDNGGLKNQTRNVDASDDNSFTDTIRYTLKARNYLKSGAVTLQSADTSVTSEERGAIHRQVTMSVRAGEAGNGNKRPLAGDYQDTVHVTVALTV